MTALRISLLGGLQVADGADRPLPVRARKNRALLAVLASAPGKRFPREWLASLLWESHGDAQARASLRQALSALRRDLGAAAAALAADAEAVWLDPGQAEVDLARVRALMDSPDPDDPGRAACLVAGPFLEGLELREQAFHEWLEQERQRAHGVACRALRRSAFERQATDPAAAVADLHRCLELEPNDESAHRDLMRAYAAAGRTAEALQHYEQLCRMLQSELATGPAAETERLATELRQQPAAPAHGREETAAGPADGVAAHASGPPSRAAPGIRHAVVVSGRFDLPAAGVEQDPEALHTAAGALLETAEAVVTSHGGRFHWRGGSRFLGVFGLERARGSEAERAARTALDLQERQQDGAGAESGAVLRCAVTAGRVVAEAAGATPEAAGRITGSPVDLAERIEALVPANEVLIDDTARGLLEEHTELVLESGASVDGEATWRLESMAHRAPAVQRTPFVGRAYELAEVERVLEGSRREHCAHVVLLRGEAGIGKTRLLSEVGRRSRALGFEWHAATLLDFGVAEGEDAIAILVRSLLGQQPLERKADVDALSEQGILGTEQVPFLLDLLDIPQPADMRAVYSAMDVDTRRHGQAGVMGHLIARRCAQSPVLISFEDIHWADTATLRMIADVTRRIADAPAVVMLTTRTEGDPIDRAWLASTRGVRMITLDLVPLRAAEARELAMRFGGADDEALEACVDRAEGNPLFLVQLLLGAREPDGAPVPATIQHLVQTRLDSLDVDLRAMLQVAAVLGQHFMPGDLEAVLEEVPAYDRLVDSYLVQPHGDAYAFSHALIRDAILESMLGSHRRELHARAARWFAGRDPILHARHLDSARDPAAPTAYLEAARQQVAAFRYDRAVELLERGLALSRDPVERCRLLTMQGEALTDAGRMHDAIAVLRQAQAEATDPGVHSRILIDIAAAMRVTDQIDEAFTLLDEAEPMARQAGLSIELARLCELRGSLCFPRGRVRECLEWQQRACRHAGDAGLPELEAQALGGLSDAYYALGYLLQAQASYGRCVELAEGHGLWRIVAGNLVQIGSLHKYLMQLEQGLEDARRAIELARTVGHHRAELNAHNSMAFMLEETGAAEEMLQHAERADALIARLESRRFAPRALYYRAKAHALLGDSGRAQEVLEQAWRLCREEGDTAFIGPSVCAALALASDDAPRRRHLLDEARGLLDEGAVFHNIVEYHRDAIEVALDEGDAATALSLADALEAAMAHEPTPFTDCLVERARLLARWSAGERGDEVHSALQHLHDRLRQASFHVLAARIGDTLAAA